VGGVGTVGGEPEPGAAVSRGPTASSEVTRLLHGLSAHALSSGSRPSGPDEISVGLVL
jgi:hypothetical protein